MSRLLEQEEIVVKLLKAIQENPELPQRELARKLGVSIGKTNYVIKALINKGIIKTQRFLNSKNKWAYRYILTPEGIKEKTRITKEFVKRKIKEYKKLLDE